MLFVKIGHEWFEYDKENSIVTNYNGGFRKITDTIVEITEYENWNDLYEQTQYCPLEVTVKWTEVWLSPNGHFFNGEAHENRAEDILAIMYGKTDVLWAGDQLEEMGWVRAATGLMWEVRLASGYWENKSLTQIQYDALWDWCQYHKKRFPDNIKIV